MGSVVTTVSIIIKWLCMSAYVRDLAYFWLRLKNSFPWPKTFQIPKFDKMFAVFTNVVIWAWNLTYAVTSKRLLRRLRHLQLLQNVSIIVHLSLSVRDFCAQAYGCECFNITPYYSRSTPWFGWQTETLRILSSISFNLLSSNISDE